MFSWFEKNAPIRTKFRTLLIAYTGTSAVSLGAIAYANAGHGEAALAIGGGALGVTALIGVISARLITTPYVNTVVRMEGLASGDLDSPIGYTEFRDCVGRMTRAMGVFRDNAREIAVHAPRRSRSSPRWAPVSAGWRGAISARGSTTRSRPTTTGCGRITTPRSRS